MVDVSNVVGDKGIASAGFEPTRTNVHGCLRPTP